MFVKGCLEFLLRDDLDTMQLVSRYWRTAVEEDQMRLSLRKFEEVNIDKNSVCIFDCAASHNAYENAAFEKQQSLDSTSSLDAFEIRLDVNEEASLIEAFYRLRNSFIVSLAFDDAHTGELFDYSFTFNRLLLSTWRKAIAKWPMIVRSVSLRNPDYDGISMQEVFAFFESDLGATAYVFEGGWYADEPCELDLTEVREAQDVSIVAGAEYMPQKSILNFAFNSNCKRLTLFEPDSSYAIGFEFVTHFVKRFLLVASTRKMVQCCKLSCIGQPDPANDLWTRPSQIAVSNAFNYPVCYAGKKPSLVCDIYHFQNRSDKQWVTVMISRPVRVSQYGWLTFVNLRRGYLELAADN